MQKSLIAIVVSGFFTLTALAAEPIAKEETTPPPAEGPFTSDQIPPYNSMPANKALQQLKPTSNGEIPTPPTHSAPTATNPGQFAPGQLPGDQTQFSPHTPPNQPSFAPANQPQSPHQPSLPGNPSANPPQFVPSDSGQPSPAAPSSYSNPM